MVSVPLSPRGYLWLDRLTKLGGLLAIVAALDGAAGSYSWLLGVLGLAVGTVTIFLDPPDQ
ncbi:hypothetical protein QA599_20295 [Haloarculaceae archaeon H-GB1-1]|nr:hypothetical protein [Haloarculaceae archaeon H-GB1-1]